MITKSPAWDIDNRKERPEELIYILKKGGESPLRPVLTMGEARDVNPAMVRPERVLIRLMRTGGVDECEHTITFPQLHLVRDCWNENPADRPKMDTVKSLLRSMHSGRFSVY